jgi:predicted TIM-barrel fold metal-dependent hydrolase
MYQGPRVDAHHHIWRLRDLPWLNGPPVPRIFGAYAAIRRDYLLAEFLADARPQRVCASVYVQANWPEDAALEEVRWVQGEADAAGFEMAIVGYAPLADPQVGRLIEAQSAFAGVRGIRQQLHWHRNPLYCFASRADWVNDPAWRAGLALLPARGLVFELQVFPGQMADAARLVAAFPQVHFVLLHAGMLEDRSPAGWAQWREGMRALAGAPNVYTKLSGLGTFARECSVDLWRPVVRETLALFGPGRCMFGSNFPVESLWTGYAQLVGVMDRCLADLDEAGQRAVWHDTACAVYRIGAAHDAARPSASGANPQADR